ncbi:Metallo-dependent phosphatase-like protein [Mycena sanguinolenta]|nr:Metallo-dependent phosphatase-like protein [Mycena sanguinolenta]
MPPHLLPHRTLITSSTSVVQLEHSAHGSRSKPGENWTRFVLISDTHTSIFSVPDGDVLVHSGDLTNRGTLQEFEITMEWLYALPHPVKIVVAGNHDYALDGGWYMNNWRKLYTPGGFYEEPEPESTAAIRELFVGQRARDAGIVYLENEEHKFRAREGGKEWSIFGSPCTPVTGQWGFGYKPADGKAVVANYPKTDILITHGPPHNILDATNRKEYAGCPALASRVRELRPRLHVFGHIHESRGAYVHIWDEDYGLPNVQNDAQVQLDVDAKSKRASFLGRNKSTASSNLLGKLWPFDGTWRSL